MLIKYWQCPWCHRAWDHADGLAMHYRSTSHDEQATNPSLQYLISIAPPEYPAFSRR